jgi:hypothetical protein
MCGDCGTTQLVAIRVPIVQDCRVGALPCNNGRAMNPRPSSTQSAKSATEPKLQSGLPGTPEEQRRGLRAAMKMHAETLRRLAQ